MASAVTVYHDGWVMLLGLRTGDRLEVERTVNVV